MTSLAPGETALVVSDTAAFTSRYGGRPPGGRRLHRPSRQRGGDDSSGRCARGRRSWNLPTTTRWYPITDGLGFSLEIVDESAHWSRWESRTQWRSSGSSLGSPGVDGSPVAIAGVLVNEALTHTDLPEVDTIELYNPTAGTVDVGGWFLTDDFFTPGSTGSRPAPPWPRART